MIGRPGRPLARAPWAPEPAHGRLAGAVSVLVLLDVAPGAPPASAWTGPMMPQTPLPPRPTCGSRETVPILSGYPSFEMFATSDRSSPR